MYGFISWGHTKKGPPKNNLAEAKKVQIRQCIIRNNTKEKRDMIDFHIFSAFV